MVFEPIAYGGQYPPLKPRSSHDVNSFAALHASLRQSLPELAREGDRILNEEMLARLVDGVMRFQCDHLGRKSKSRYWPALRIPSPLFSDRKSYPNGPLGVMVLSAFRIKQVSAWRNFNFDNAKLFDDNVAIIKRMESDLLDRGYLRRPVIFFDPSVERGLGKEELRRLVKIAVRFGAKVLEQEDALASGRVTHVIAYDPEEHDADDVIAEERERESGVGVDDDDDVGHDGGGRGGKSSHDSEKKFLRTLAVVDAPLSDDDDDDDDDGGVGSTPSGGYTRRKATRKMALVHWWYHPSSYDEWLPASEVPAAIEGEENHGILPGGGACVVGCKFVRDVERFNEWGVEADYAVMEYERKVDCLRPRSVGEGIGASLDPKTVRSGKGNNKRVIANDDDDGEGGAAKRARSAGHDDDDDDDDAEINVDAPAVAVTAPASKKCRTKNSGGHVKPPTAAALGSRRPTSERRSISGGGGMNPRGILTGLRGKRGEVVRRIVHDGALRVDDEAHAVIRDALADYLSGPTPTLAARPEWRKLLPATGFVRPSVDASLGCMIVTELTLSEEGGRGSEDAADVGGGGTTAVPTLAVNRTVPILIPPEANAMGSDISVAMGCGGEEPLAMRGGGDDPTWQQRHEIVETVNIAVPAEGEGNEVEAIGFPEESCPSIGGGIDIATENTNNFEFTDSIGVVDTENITDPRDDAFAKLGEDAMQLKEEGTASTAPEECIREEVATLQATEQPPEEMPSTEGAIATIELEGNSHSLSPVESVHQEVWTPTEDEPRTKQPFEAPQETSGDSKSGPEQPSWYHPTKPSDFERRILPEWFDCTAPHRTESSYVATREKILSLAKRNTQQFITSTAIRRSVVGDAGSLLRLHKFLMDYGLLNCGQIGETAPGDSVLRGLHAPGGALAGTKRKHSSAMAWTAERFRALEASVVKHVSKKTVDGSPDQVSLVVDWDAVAADVGGGTTALDCQVGFVHSSVEDVKVSVSSMKSLVSNIVNGVHPDVLKAVVETSLRSTSDINEARNSSFVAVVATAAAQRGARVESEIENTLMDIVDQRIQRLENRLALLDDVEALLEAERVSLELERRDMYTARCRHWFGDGSL
ncbi:hypothetical protein ACHAXA_004252 [Cyclostephanos tholiformis]|uniref:Uncharacterized protein n=1 Tax=Cyclostephanos tholiformis TaxID=382380 RepID=A0ABD3RFU4_9STRA